MSKKKATVKPLIVGKKTTSDKLTFQISGRQSKYSKLVEQARTELKKAKDSLEVAVPAGVDTASFRNRIGMLLRDHAPAGKHFRFLLTTSGTVAVVLADGPRPRLGGRKTNKPVEKPVAKKIKPKAKAKKSKPKASPLKHTPTDETAPAPSEPDSAKVD